MVSKVKMGKRIVVITAICMVIFSIYLVNAIDVSGIDVSNHVMTVSRNSPAPVYGTEVQLPEVIQPSVTPRTFR